MFYYNFSSFSSNFLHFDKYLETSISDIAEKFVDKIICWEGLKINVMITNPKVLASDIEFLKKIQWNLAIFEISDERKDENLIFDNFTEVEKIIFYITLKRR